VTSRQVGGVILRAAINTCVSCCRTKKNINFAYFVPLFVCVFLWVSP